MLNHDLTCIDLDQNCYLFGVEHADVLAFLDGAPPGRVVDPSDTREITVR